LTAASQGFDGLEEFAGRLVIHQSNDHWFIWEQVGDIEIYLHGQLVHKWYLPDHEFGSRAGEEWVASCSGQGKERWRKAG
jgi:hypothetical protein